MTAFNAQPIPLSRRDADFLLLAFRGFRAIATGEQRAFRSAPEGPLPARPPPSPDRP